MKGEYRISGGDDRRVGEDGLKREIHVIGGRSRISSVKKRPHSLLYRQNSEHRVVFALLQHNIVCKQITYNAVCDHLGFFQILIILIDEIRQRQFNHGLRLNIVKLLFVYSFLREFTCT
jgi:hypothetical protein